MITLNLYWPEQRSRRALGDNETVIFDVGSGQFFSPAKAPCEEGVIFSHSAEGLSLLNAQQLLPCYVDGHPLAFQEGHPLRIQSSIQLARYGITVENEETDKSLLQELGYADGCGNDAQLPELVEILHNSLQHVTEAPENEKRDILKSLEKEFRQALIWGIQQPHAQQPGPRRDNRFNENVFHFDRVQAQVKSATVTHCIFETPALIHKVFNELEIAASDRIQAEEQTKTDVLKLLAPEEVRYDTQKRIPALLVQDIYRADLDTLL
ncbi:TagK domain-containing protein [Enterobacteriaceae bacterium C34A]